LIVSPSATGSPVLRFGKGECKEQIARQYFRAAEREGRFGVVLIGVAQENTTGWRGWRRGGPDGHPHFEFARQQVFANHYYVRDPEWGRRSSRPAPAYVRWPAWVYLNGQRMALPSRLLRACSVRGGVLGSPRARANALVEANGDFPGQPPWAAEAPEHRRPRASPQGSQLRRRATLPASRSLTSCYSAT
jgi:hypothetical protein